MLATAFRAALGCTVAAAALLATPARADAHFPVTTAFSNVLADLIEAAHTPAWYERREGVDPLDADGHASRDSMHLVVQEDGLGGSDVLTVRYPIDTDGIFRTFVGAGVGRANYYEERADAAVVPFAFRDSHHSLGAVAEVGSEWHASERLRVNASVRWTDTGDAQAARTDDGPVAADPLVLAVGLGFRFR